MLRLNSICKHNLFLLPILVLFVQTKAESESINRQEEEEEMPLATKRETFEMNRTEEK